MNIPSRINLNKAISVFLAVSMLSTAGFSFYQGSQVYAQEDNSIEFPIDSLTKILNSVDKANAALSDGDDELVSQNLQEIETQVRDQLGQINVPINDTSSDEIDDVLVQENN